MVQTIHQGLKIMRIPCHVAVIPDGNRRWAEQQKLPIIKGHQKGAGILRDILETAFDLGIQHFSFWGESESNIRKRSKLAVAGLDKIFEKKFNDLVKEKKIHERKVKINVFGKWQELLGEKTTDAIQRAIDVTKNYNQRTLNFFIAYDGTGEMLDAVSMILEKSRQDPGMQMTPELLKQNLFTRNLPPVDLLIRTGGEPHLSAGFMMWDLANAQLYFPDKLWPEFTPEDFKKAIEDYAQRGRRFGE